MAISCDTFISYHNINQIIQFCTMCITLIKSLNMSAEPLAEFQAVLEKHRANEAIYKQKLKDINLTRGKIADQLEVLQQTYDKKIKNLEQRLEGLRSQNDSLSRENTLYKSQIESYQSRLLQKEKIIAALLSQRKDLLVVSSQKSKSDKTDSNANEQESKSFKKAAFKQDYEHPVADKFKQESPAERERHNVEPLAATKIEKNIQKPVQSDVKSPPKKKLPPAVNIPTQEGISKEQIPQNDQPPIIQPSEHEQPAVVRHPPPPPVHKPNKQKHRKAPPARKFQVEINHQEEPIDANNFFSNLGMPVQHEQVAQVKDIQQERPESHQMNYLLEQEEAIVPQPQPQHQHQHQQEEIDLVDQQIQPNQTDQQFAPQFQEQHYEPPQQQHEEHYSHHQTEQHTPQQSHNYTAQPQQDQSNFLSHFTQHQPEAQNFYQPPVRSKPKKKKRPTRQEATAEAVDHEVSGSDFFANLSKNEHDPQHHLDIEESSIDHIDRDNSLLSNEQPYFTEETAPAKRAVKMPKKKAKREQIKMMDPSCFD